MSDSEDWQRFALVDCAQDDALHAALLHQAHTADVPVRCLFDGQPEAEWPAQAPWLLAVPLNERTRDLTAWLNHHHHESAAVAWLAADGHFDALFVHLQGHMDALLPDGSLGLLRFWDARVFVRLQRVFALDQQVALMGPVLEWQIHLGGEFYHVSRDSLLEQIRAAEADQEVADVDAHA